MPEPRFPARENDTSVTAQGQRQWPLRVHLALFAAILILPAVVFTGVLIKQFADDLQREAEARIVQLTRDLADDVANEIERSMTLLRALAIPLTSSSEDTAPRREEALHVIDDPDQTLRVFDVSGRLLSTSVTNSVGGDRYSDMAILEHVVASGQPLLTGLIPARDGEPAKVDLLYPAVRNGVVGRILVLSLSAERFRKILGSQFITSELTTGLSDERGVLIARSRLHDEYLGRQLPPEILSLSKPGTPPHRIDSVDGRPIIRAVSRLRGSEWIASASVTQEHIDGTIRRAVLSFAGLGLALLTLSTLLVGAYANRLVAAFRHLGHGGADAAILPDTMVLEANEASKSLRTMLDELRFSRHALQTALDVSGIVTWGWDEARQLKLWTASGKRMFGVPADAEITRELFRSLLHPSDIPRYEKAWEAALGPSGGGHYELEYRITRPIDRRERWIKSAAVVEFDGGRPMRMIGAALDITEQKTREEHVSTLLREVNHRSKNLLAVVLAVARQTTAASMDQFVDRFAQRIQALSASQDLLVQSSWRGVDLASLIRAQLGHLSEPSDGQITVDGPPVQISSSAAQTLGMAIHELATNAAKYGALSTNNGVVTVSWSLDPSESRLLLSWSERGGPSVTKPNRAGFGTNVLTHVCRAGLNAEVDLTFDEAGLQWHMACPFDSVRDRSTPVLEEESPAPTLAGPV